MPSMAEVHSSLSAQLGTTEVRAAGEGIGWQGAVALAEALKTNTTVQTIDLGSNRIGPEGAVALAEALKTNTTVQKIDLGSNSIGPEGAVALAEALKTNRPGGRCGAGRGAKDQHDGAASFDASSGSLLEVRGELVLSRL